MISEKFQEPENGYIEMEKIEPDNIKAYIY